MTKKKLLKKIYLQSKKADEWIDKVPWEIRAGYFDNPCVVAANMNMESCLNYIFQDQEQGWAYWFLYDWGNNRSLSLAIDGREYTFDDADKLLDFMFSQHLIEE